MKLEVKRGEEDLGSIYGQNEEDEKKLKKWEIEHLVVLHVHHIFFTENDCTWKVGCKKTWGATHGFRLDFSTENIKFQCNLITKKNREKI